MNSPNLQRGFFLLLLAAITVGFAWILMPFFGAVLWGVSLAILFTPAFRRIHRWMPGKPTLAALATLAICLVIVIIPLILVGISLVQEVDAVRQKISSGQIDFAAYFQKILDAAPSWLTNLINRFDLGDTSSWRERIAKGATQGSQWVASQALAIGQNTFQFLISFFVMLYLLFFLLRDGAALSRTVRRALPLSDEHGNALLTKFTTVIKATVKGNITVALVQGVLGGLAFWFLDVQGVLLWAALMGFLSLLPAIGAALIWGPVAIYFLATGSILQGVGLAVYGALVIGSVDNVLRPILVGKETQMPDYIVLLSTIRGIARFGINGFIIGPVVAALFMACWSLFSDSSSGAGSDPNPAQPASRKRSNNLP